MIFRLKKALLLLIVASPVSAKIPPPPPSEPDISLPTARSGADGAVINARDLQILIRQAESGDGAAAFRVSSHFEALDKSTEERYWLILAAARGNLIAQFNLAVSLGELEECDSKIEALAWLQSAAAAGDSSAIERLQAYKSSAKACGLP